MKQFHIISMSTLAGGAIVDCKFHPFEGKSKLIVSSVQVPNELVLYDLRKGTSKILDGHRSTVSRVFFSRNGESIISCGYDKCIRVWSSFDGTPYHTFEARSNENPIGHLNSISVLALHSTHNAIIASSGNDKILNLWNIESRERLAELASQEDSINWPGPLLDMCFCNGSNWSDYLIGGTDSSPNSNRSGSIKIWNVAQCALITTLGNCHHGSIGALFSDRENCFFSGATDGIVQKFDLRSLKAIHAYYTEQNDINLVSLSPDERYLQSSGSDNRIVIFDQRFPERPVHVLSHESLYEVGSDMQGIATAEWTRHGFLITGGEDNMVYKQLILWHLIIVNNQISACACFYVRGTHMGY